MRVIKAEVESKAHFLPYGVLPLLHSSPSVTSTSCSSPSDIASSAPIICQKHWRFPLLCWSPYHTGLLRTYFLSIVSFKVQVVWDMGYPYNTSQRIWTMSSQQCSSQFLLKLCLSLSLEWNSLTLVSTWSIKCIMYYINFRTELIFKYRKYKPQWKLEVKDPGLDKRCTSNLNEFIAFKMFITI